mmetsp:Transcript_20091/g.43614  ORF Transcript_20091/g.43614 Transcript_20091/m.43614 type:complete len:479 (+) Transcript_20091:134-1570(+)|eukprot:CAMPEP_0172314736 /NCGR_PEP_ID=MMETSP1058-20130122/23286_1 /TAXON_ID=83371 /ORGANISM="Detonula confervacea, Strain CCMP 353" /LENGTH=478 /DNA_ID=CAMNT_0013028677 /DNA_START=48 /DNA_END=1484 /DNA_ORIENTATION=+
MYGDINGGKGGRRGGVVGSADLYRRVPKEMTESTKIGVIMSLLSIVIMIILFFCETWAFFAQTKINSSIEIDPNAEQLLRLNFNVTLYDVQCDFVSVDVWDTLGTDLQNVTKDITKWTIDDEGTRQKFHGRNKHERALAHEDHSKTALQDISNANIGEELHYSTDLSPENLKEFYKEHNLAMVDYFAPWCIWCQRLAPTWEKFAAQVKSQEINLGVGKVDCVQHEQMCKDERVMAFPMLRWYEGGKAIMPDYRGDRTVEALLEYAKRRASSSEGGGGDGGDDDRAEDEFAEEHHPGCQVSGHMMVNRVPGDLHIEAKSTNHAINSAMTNLTHRVNHLSFGTPHGPQGHVLSFLPFFSDIPENFKRTNPMKDKYYPTYHFHEAFHHHLKIISTHVDYMFSHSTVLYQILEESQLVYFDVQNIPEIKFLWDMSPMSVNLTKEGRPWYEYATSLLAIIGGTYTTLGLINATLLRIFKPKKF